jgi:hypothetical protein
MYNLIFLSPVVYYLNRRQTESYKNIFTALYSQPHYGPGVDSASNRNEYQEPSWG